MNWEPWRIHSASYANCVMSVWTGLDGPGQLQVFEKQPLTWQTMVQDDEDGDSNRVK